MKSPTTADPLQLRNNRIVPEELEFLWHKMQKRVEVGAMGLQSYPMYTDHCIRITFLCHLTDFILNRYTHSLLKHPHHPLPSHSLANGGRSLQSEHYVFLSA